MELEALLYEYGNQNFNFVPPKANFLHVVVEAALSLQQRNLLHHQRHGIERDGKNRIHLKIKLEEKRCQLRITATSIQL